MRTRRKEARRSAALQAALTFDARYEPLFGARTISEARRRILELADAFAEYLRTGNTDKGCPPRRA